MKKFGKKLDAKPGTRESQGRMGVKRIGSACAGTRGQSYNSSKKLKASFLIPASGSGLGTSK